MKKAISVLALFTILLFAVSAIAQNKVVVVPLGKKPTGDAVAADVLKGKTFSNADTIGMVGVRPLVPIAKTGQTTSYATGDDGNLQKGATWPNPRFTENGDGTVTDNLTGLVWLRDANCINSWYSGFDNDVNPDDGRVTWQHALDFVAGMNNNADPASATYADCNAGFTDWRLPNIKELQPLMDFGKYNPALPAGHPFSGVVLDYYWSSTSCADAPSYTYGVNLRFGYSYFKVKSDDFYVWPVRGGQ